MRKEYKVTYTYGGTRGTVHEATFPASSEDGAAMAIYDVLRSLNAMGAKDTDGVPLEDPHVFNVEEVNS